MKSKITTSVGCASCHASKPKVHASKTTLLLFLTLLLCIPAYAQISDSLFLLFESRRDLRLALGDNANLWRQNDRRDANGDSLPELALIVGDGAGNPEAFHVYFNVNGIYLDSALYVVDWSTLVDALDGQEPTRFLGFYPFFGSDSGLKDLVFRTEDGLAIIAILIGQKRASASASMFRLKASQVAIADLNDDGAAELIVRNAETKTVQVWGRGPTSTATEGEIEASLLRLFQNYPNPFREATTIAYAVEQPGPVTVTVYDLLGRRVRTLVDERQPAGTYHVSWDGRDTGGQSAASGTYFYRLRVGEAVSSKQALRIK